MASGITFSGLGSGVSGSRLARTLFDQLTNSNEVRSKQIRAVEAEGSSLEKLRTLLLNVASSLDDFRSIYGGSRAMSATSSNIDIASAVADSSAQAGSYSLNVLSVAKSASGSFDRSFSSKYDFIVSDASQTGDVHFRVGEGEGVFEFDVSVGELTTAEDFVQAFNTAADGQASASLANLGTEESPDFRILFSSDEQGTAKGSLEITADNQALFDGGVLSTHTLEQATNAQFTISGVSGVVERDSNKISNLIPGLTLQLNAVGTSEITIANDPSAGAGKMEEFISSFNSLVDFIKKEDSISVTVKDGEVVNSNGSLVRTEVDDNALYALRDAVANTRSSSGLTLASMGVSTNIDGTLSFDREVFEAAAKENPDAVAEIQTKLADSIGNTQGIVDQFTGFGRAIDSAIRTNEQEINNLNNTNAGVERTASSREDAMLKSFTNFEGLLARLNADSMLISSLLEF